MKVSLPEALLSDVPIFEQGPGVGRTGQHASPGPRSRIIELTSCNRTAPIAPSTHTHYDRTETSC